MNFKVARAELHHWEEPVVSGEKGSGTIFFCGCTMQCKFCQNYEISSGKGGLDITDKELLSLFLSLEQEGAHNINLVTPTPYARSLVPVLEEFKKRSSLPVVYNTNSYERVENLVKLDGLIDVYLPDLKYKSDTYAVEFSNAPRYFEIATKAISEMLRQQPQNIVENGLIKKGVIIRHLVLPTLVEDSKEVLDYLARFDKKPLISLMAQYFPTENVKDHPILSRRISQEEYDRVLDYADVLGFTEGFIQDPTSATEDYVPSFDLNLLKKRLGKM